MGQHTQTVLVAPAGPGPPGKDEHDSQHVVHKTAQMCRRRSCPHAFTQEAGPYYLISLLPRQRSTFFSLKRKKDKQPLITDKPQFLRRNQCVPMLHWAPVGFPIHHQWSVIPANMGISCLCASSEFCSRIGWNLHVHTHTPVQP